MALERTLALYPVFHHSYHRLQYKKRGDLVKFVTIYATDIIT